VRGYDGVDPALFVRLFSLTCDSASNSPAYAVTMLAVPKVVYDGIHTKLHPVADLLNVRYLLTRGQLDADLPIIWHQDDYWILENPHVLPRAFVPRTSRVVRSDDEALSIMESRLFAPRAVVLTSTHLSVPDVMEGAATIHYESPTRVHLDADMRTDGIVVESDLWDSGWKATLDGVPCAIERVDVALRGLRIPSGRHSIVLIYDPLSVRLGCQLTALGTCAFLLWVIGLVLRRGGRFCQT
jgi:hypothetical protein